MKKKLQMFLTLALFLGGTTTAWAENTVTVTTGGSSTEYETLSAAISAGVLTSASADMTITISANQSLGSSVISWEKAYTLTIKATEDITIKGPNGSRWFTAKNAGANLVVGDGNYEITLDGEYSGGTTKQRTAPVALHNNTTASITFNKVTFANFNLNNAVNMIVGENGDGVITLQDVTIDNCVNPKDAYIVNQRPVNSKIVLKGYLNIDANSSGIAINAYLETKDSGTNGRILVDDSSAALTATKKITVTFTEKSTTLVPKIGAAFIVNTTNNFTDETASVFALANDVNYGLYKQNKDLKLTQAYTLAVGEAAAATLILPFEAKIPSTAKTYKLSYTSGSSVDATEVETTLAANTPVLVNAAKGNHKFVSTATSGDAATGSGTHTVGALTGVYVETTVPSTSFILAKVGDNVGFYKADGSTNKVQPKHAYLSVGTLSARELFINYDNTTGIAEIEKMRNGENETFYDLSGRKVAQPTKGLYIVNGKKVVIK